MPLTDVVLTGVGVVSPVGIGRERFWQSLHSGQSGIRWLTLGNGSPPPSRIGGEVPDFGAVQLGVPKKSLKVMARDAQLGVAASILACRDAGILQGRVDPQRIGVTLGADRICSSLEHSEPPYRACMPEGLFDVRCWGKEGMAVAFPLSFLRVLPNMIASHISIVHDARGPNNTIHHAEVSGLLAIAEAVRVIQRGMADAMIAGGASSQLAPFDRVRHFLYGRLSPPRDPPAAMMRPFDADRCGEVRGEGAAAVVLESRRHAEVRGATILARIAGWATGFEPHPGRPLEGTALRRVIAQAIDWAGLTPADIGHVQAQGFGVRDDDAIEARAIRETLGDVPVTAVSSYLGNLDSAAGAMEMAAGVMALGAGRIPPTLNYQRPDPACPVRVVADAPLETSRPTALLLNWTPLGQAVAMVIAAP